MPTHGILKRSAVLALLMGALTFVASAAAANTYTTFGQATVNADGSTTITSSTAGVGYGGINIPVASGTTLAGISSLSTNFQVVAGDCGGGAPRYAITLSGGKSVFVYFGPTPSFTGCGSALQSTGNVATGGTLRVDSTQLGGPFYGTWAQAVALAGSQTITDLSIVVDADWVTGDNPQSVTLSDVVLNGTTFGPAVAPPTSKAQCKDGGWKSFTSPTFKNQGDCVSFVATDGRNG